MTEAELEQRLVSIEQAIQALWNHQGSLGQSHNTSAEAAIQATQAVRELREVIATRPPREEVYGYVRTTVQQAVSEAARQVAFPDWQRQWRQQWNRMTHFAPGAVPEDPRLFNLLYERIRRYVMTKVRRDVVNPEPTRVGDYLYYE
jgi:hypothetical protein